MDAAQQKSLLTSPYAKEFLSELIRKTESYKFNRAVEELRIVSTSIVELKEILIALTIAVYIVALCYAISLCLKITRRTRRVAKADVESHCITPPFTKSDIPRRPSWEELEKMRNGAPVNGTISNGYINKISTPDRPPSVTIKTQPFERNKTMTSSCKRRQTMVQLLENIEKGSLNGDNERREL